MSCEHEDGCGCGDDWNQMRREAYQAGKRVGKADGEKAAEARIVAWLLDTEKHTFETLESAKIARAIEKGEHREGK